MTHIIAGTPEARRVKKIWLDGVLLTTGGGPTCVNRKMVVELDDEQGWIIRYATQQEIHRLVLEPGLVWPRDKDVLIQERGEVRIEIEDE